MLILSDHPEIEVKFKISKYGVFDSNKEVSSDN